MQFVALLLILTLSSLGFCEEKPVAPAEITTILPCTFKQPAVRPGLGLNVTFHWDARPIGKPYTAFVHISSVDGKTKFQGDHAPVKATTDWSGKVEYEKLIVTPVDAPPGEYRIEAGLYDKVGKQKLKAGEGVTDMAAGEVFQIGTFTIANDAPIPPLPAPTLKLDGYKLTFDENFNDLSISAWGPGTRWIAHTPYAGDFGDAYFGNPEKDSPFTIENGILRIEAKKVGKKWQAGLISSVDGKGQGFSQKYGYFEMRAKFPKGPGVWPAFWIMGVPQLLDKTLTNCEIDVVEAYGVNMNVLHTTVHLWGPNKFHTGEGDHFIVPGMTEDFHTYGAMVDEKEIIVYYDGVELRRWKTPEQAKVPMYIMVDLALGGGWPINKTPNPSYMYVDYVRVYAKQ